jgi:hypothetical protein
MRANACVGIVLLASLAAPAARGDGRIALWRPTVIDSPGHYVVTRDIFPSSSVPTSSTIEIRATDVVLDLNGHTVFGSSESTIRIVATTAPGSIEIRNGLLRREGADGLLYQEAASGGSATRLRLERLDISGPGVRAAIHVTGAPVVEILRCSIRAPNAYAGIEIWPGSLARWTGLIADNRLRDIAGQGIAVIGMAGGLIAHNVVTEFGTFYFGETVPPFAIHVDGGHGGIRIEGNLVHGEGYLPHLHGIVLDDLGPASAVVDNVLSGNLYAGIWTQAHGGLVAGNVVGATWTFGMLIDGNENTVSRNVVESGDMGVAIRGRHNLVDSNLIEGHWSYGLNFGTDGAGTNVYRGNMLHNNPGTPVVGEAVDGGGNLQ